MRQPLRWVSLVTAWLATTLTASGQELAVNGGFEEMEMTSAGFPGGTGDWSGDFSAIVDGVALAVPPLEGVGMLQFIYTRQTGPGSAASDVYQTVDLTAVAGSVTDGVATFRGSAWFNRVAGDANTDTAFQLRLYAFSGPASAFPVQVGSGAYLAVASTSVLTDDDPMTWEEAAVELLLPATTTYAAVGVSAIENVFNQSSGVEFDGHFVDEVSLQVEVPDPNQPPNCFGGGETLIASADALFQHLVTATDPNAGDLLTLSHEALPAGASVTPPAGSSATGQLDCVLAWTPSTADLGPHAFALTFTDEAGASATCEFTVVVNARPQPRFTWQTMAHVGHHAVVRFDASETLDLDHATEDLALAWSVAYDEGGEPIEVSGAVVELMLAPGHYSVSLSATDPLGASSETHEEFELEGAPALAFLGLRTARVTWGNELGQVVLRGTLGLPAGVDPDELQPTVGLRLEVAGEEVLAEVVDGLSTYGRGERHWRHADRESVTGLKRLRLHWKPAHWAYDERRYPLTFRSLELGSEETVLSLVTSCRLKRAVAVHVADRAVVHLHRHGDASSEGEVDVEGHHGRFALRFPFAFDAETRIRVVGAGLDRELRVGDRLVPASASFALSVTFDAGAFPAGAQSEPRRLGLALMVGERSFLGTAALEEDSLHVRRNHWLKGFSGGHAGPARGLLALVSRRISGR